MLSFPHFITKALEKSPNYLDDHVENLFKGDLQVAQRFFAENMKNGKMHAQLTSFGNRVITVEGFEGSVKISTLSHLLGDAAVTGVRMELNADERLAGLDIVTMLRQLNGQISKELKNRNLLIRFAAQDWKDDSNVKKLDTPELFFKMYNRAQIEKDFPRAPKPKKFNSGLLFMYSVDPTTKDMPSRYLDPESKKIVACKDPKLAENLIPVHKLDTLRYEGFIVSTQQIRRTQQAAAKAIAQASQIISQAANAASRVA